MPIKGMTDKQRPAFPRIGVLRKGAKKPEKGPGKDLKWFRFVTDDAEAQIAFLDAFDKNPTRIEVMLPFAATDENFEAWMEEWGTGSLKHRCDGETCVVWQDDGIYKHTPKPCPGGCKPTGRLMVIVPALQRLAYVQVLTTSKHDILELSANLKAAEETARLMNRDLRGIPFILTRVPREISTPRGNGQRVRAEKWLLHIEPAPAWVSLQIEAAQRMAMPLLETTDDLVPPNGDNGDIEHPETEIVGEEPEPEPAANDNDKWPARPWNAETTRAALNKALETIDPDGRKTLETYRKSALATLSKLTLGNDDARHKLTWYLFSEESTKELTLKHFAVITDKWTKVTPPDFEPDPSAVEETQNILEALGFETEAATEAA